MEGFKISSDCIIKKSSKTIAKELLKGSFVIGCDYKNKQLALENVFHYEESKSMMGIYTLFSDTNNTKRQLRLDTAFVLSGNGNILKEIKNILNAGINDYELFVIDKYKNLYTETVYDQYGGSMKLA